MLSDAGSGEPTLNKNPDSQDVTGKVFEYVEPQDVIAAGPIVPGQEGGPPPPAPVPPYNESYALQFGNGCNDVYWQTSQSMVDPGMISVHSERPGTTTAARSRGMRPTRSTSTSFAPNTASARLSKACCDRAAAHVARCHAGGRAAALCGTCRSGPPLCLPGQRRT